MTSLRRLSNFRTIVTCARQHASFVPKVQFSLVVSDQNKLVSNKKIWSSSSFFSTKVDAISAPEKSETDNTNKSESPNSQENQINTGKQKLGLLTGKLKLAFTCKKCSTRSYKVISKIAYNKGIVIVRCDGCKVNHLIADNLGWFDLPQGVRNIEHILRQKGESVRRLWNDTDGYFEAIDQEEFRKLQEQSTSEENDKKSVHLGVQYEKVGNKGQ